MVQMAFTSYMDQCNPVGSTASRSRNQPQNRGRSIYNTVRYQCNTSDDIGDDTGPILRVL